MIRSVVPLLTCLLGCGRLDFATVSDKPAPDAPAIPSNHDEDGDGIDDALDACPHIAGGNIDSDRDGVGDACDPHPTTPGDHIGLFSTLEPGTSPFDDITGFTEESDAIRHAGDISIFITRPFGTARIELGFDMLAILGAGQHQIGVGIDRGVTPYYFAELNDNSDLAIHDFAVLSYDSVNGYVPLDSVDIPPLHTGRGIMRIDADATANTYTALGGWDGELYMASAGTPDYTGGSKVHFSLNGLDLLLRYIIIIDSP